MSETFLERTQSLATQSDENKELAQVKAKIFLARQFPRDQQQAIHNILVACQIPKIAEMAIYSYPRGDKEVKGASIRLAEVIAQSWGNFLCGVKELERFPTKSLVSSFAWDLETNYQDEKVFEINFVRNTKNGSYPVTDERDIYELIANNAARRKRSCIMAVIPQYVFELAMDACEETLLKAINKDGASIEETRNKMLVAYQQLAEWITADIISGLFGKNFDAIDANDIVKLQHLYCSIKDGFVTAEKAFGKTAGTAAQPSMEEQEKLADLANAVKNKSKKSGVNNGNTAAAVEQ